MNFVLLSGGSGTRLWPISKQFDKIFRRDDGTYESMLQRVCRQIREHYPRAAVTVAAAEDQVSAVCDQLGSDVCICREPCCRDTFPAVALAAVYLREEQGAAPDETVVVCPVDPWADDDYFKALGYLGEQAAKGEANLVLMGIEPTSPSVKYGYILPESAEQTSRAAAFHEKPDAETARGYIAQGALWNGGVFAFRLEYMLRKAHERIDFTDYKDLLAKYAALDKISFDYAVAECEPSIQVQRFSGSWKDIGTWDALLEVTEGPGTGKVLLSETCENIRVLNQLDIPIVCMGLRDAVIAASPRGILISDRDQAAQIRPVIDALIAGADDPQ